MHKIEPLYILLSGVVLAPFTFIVTPKLIEVVRYTTLVLALVGFFGILREMMKNV